MRWKAVKKGKGRMLLNHHERKRGGTRIGMPIYESSAYSKNRQMIMNRSIIFNNETLAWKLHL
ncbi:hypothetical protein A374_04679 [Fictibacillus macauensis ZFHKF-1]|uniref:Uncharacterized protein n=1 Tax=Fictibacillus macauensis ZFHKF-1 TaxID=1196324 RepID=I8UIX3_9BACL|nr:hypothetical protein A374_04679 [Fictibacillus macauensis ZFHKF-1]